MPSGGNQASRDSRSRRAPYTVAGGAAIVRLARSVLSIARF
nr:hypothetical protein JVH1_8469 [Rhodococcus sp. JVH1]